MAPKKAPASTTGTLPAAAARSSGPSSDPSGDHGKQSRDARRESPAAAASPESTQKANAISSSSRRSRGDGAHAKARGDGNFSDGDRRASTPNVASSSSVVTARNAEYRENWSRVVLGATSGIMFVLVVCLCYALYILVTPYYNSITSGVLLSIVMHPQSRLRSVLYMGTAVDRMRRVQQRWAVRGRLAGLVGSWLSLRHFASFVVMQITFVLGLNKIRVAANSVLLGSDAPAPPRGHGAVKKHGAASPQSKDAASAGESRASSPQPYTLGTSTQPAHRMRAASTDGPTSKGHRAGPPAVSASQGRDGDDNNSSGSTATASAGASSTASPTKALRFPPSLPTVSPLNCSIVLTPTTVGDVFALPATATLHDHRSFEGAVRSDHRRLVATARGRRVLRYLTLATLVVVAHLLLGVVYFALLHLALGLVFAVCVPLLQPETFVRSMGRLWRVAMAVFFMVGLTVNLTADVLSISHVVRRTTSAVVRSSGSATPAMEPSPTGSFREFSPAVPGKALHDIVAVTESVTDDPTAVTGVQVVLDSAETEDGVDPLALLSQHRGKLESLVFNQLQGLVVQELADMFSNGNVSEMLRTLMKVLPPQLQSVVQQDAVQESEKGSTRGSGTRVSPPKTSSAAANKSREPSLKFTWANVRALGSINALKSFVYASLANTSSDNATAHSAGPSSSNVSADASRAVSASASAAVPIDWVTVLRLVASRLLPYIEHALRLLVRLASNLMGLFDSIYALMLFVFFYRYLTQLEHTVLYYGVAKLLRVLEPDVGDAHARNIEHDITVSFVTLLQSFWHLTWFHFCITFCAFKVWGFPTPFLLGLVSVVLALFPLVPKWVSPCSVALVYMAVQLVSLTTAESHDGSPFLVFLEGHSWLDALVFGKPYVLAYARTLSFALALLLECGDEWLLCVSRGLRGGFATDAAGKGREQLQPFVVGTALVLGFVAYGIRGIVFGPLTVIVARVVFDNWDVVLSKGEIGGLPPPPPRSLLAEGEEEEEEEEEVAGRTC